MGLLAKIAEGIISRLKNDPSYQFKVKYSDRQLIALLLYRASQLGRGFFVRLKFTSAAGVIFAGRRIVIEHGYQIHAGPSLIIEDGVYINALSEKGVILGRNVTIAKKTIIVCTGVIANKGIGLSIGDHSAIGAQSFIGAQGGITIGSNVIMGPGVRIFSENHNYADMTVPIRLQGETRKGVIIEDDCWVGSGVTILDGVKIGSGTIVAAGSIVTKEIPPFSVVAGIPGKVIKYRNN